MSPFAIQLGLDALTDFVPFVLRYTGLNLHAQLVFRRARQRSAFSREVRHGSQLPNGANGGDDVERVAADAILLGRDDFDSAKRDTGADFGE